MVISSADVNFGLEELAGIAPGVKGKGQYNGMCMIEKLMDAYETVKEDYIRDYNPNSQRMVKKETMANIEKKLSSCFTDNKIDYSEQDISDLVEYFNAQDIDEEEFFKIGPYVGSLISMLTEKNEKLGKRTIVEIHENKLDYLGFCCKKFDVVKIGVNYGNRVFELAKEGNLLYVEDCKGNDFAQHAGVGIYGSIEAIVGVNLSGKSFAHNAGGNGGHVEVILGVNITGDRFAEWAGASQGKVRSILGLNVSGDRLAHSAGCANGRVGSIVGVNVSERVFVGDVKKDGSVYEILKNSRDADNLYNRIVQELNWAYKLGLEKVKVRKAAKRSGS